MTVLYSSLLLYSIACWASCDAPWFDALFQPYDIVCHVRGKDFLQRHINPNFFSYGAHKRMSCSGQLFQWKAKNTRHAINVQDLSSDALVVKVLLAELDNDGVWELDATAGFRVSVLQPDQIAYLVKAKRCSIKRRNNHIYLNHKLCNSALLVVESLGGKPLGFEGKLFQGNFIITWHDDQLLLINSLELEDYIHSVLKTESWPGWPLEVNKAFAIASRSYVVAKILDGMNAARKIPYHIKNTNIHQTYQGYHTNETLRRAVEETEGMLLACNKQPILAMFDCCCGGIIPAHLDGVDFSKAPYLARTEVCKFCESFKIYTWRFELSLQDLLIALQQKGWRVTHIDDIYVRMRDAAGTVQEVVIKHGKKELVLNGKQFYSLFKQIKSFAFDIAHHADSFSISGKGYGHHLGMCQWGARKMIDFGYSFKHILSFYYPGTYFMKLSLK